MAYENDDLLHRVDRAYLGPPGYTFPFKVRYAAYGVGVGVFVVLMVVVRGLLQIPWGTQSTMILIAGTIFVTSRIMRYVNGDVTVMSVCKAAYNDLTAPRPPKSGEQLLIGAPAATRLHHRHDHTGYGDTTSIDNGEASDG